MIAIVTAGGIAAPGDPLYVETQGRPKALIDVAGKPMIQWVLEALHGASRVEHLVVVGLPPEAGVPLGARHFDAGDAPVDHGGRDARDITGG